MLIIAVVEDEVLIAKRLTRFISAALNTTEHRIRHFETLDDADDYLSEHSIDLLFLDLNLNGRDGFDLLKLHLSASYHTIVVSANINRAIEAFDIGVLDFVAKPFTQERIQKSLSRILQKDEIPEIANTCKSLGIEKRGKIELIAIQKIDYIKASGHYSELILRDGTARLHSKSLNRILNILPKDFQQVHRSYIVSVKQVKEILIHPGSQYALMLHSDTTIPLGRTYYKIIKGLLAKI